MPSKSQKPSLNKEYCISGHMRLTLALPTSTSGQIQLKTNITSIKNKMQILRVISQIASES